MRYILAQMPDSYYRYGKESAEILHQVLNAVELGKKSIIVRSKLTFQDRVYINKA